MIFQKMYAEKFELHHKYLLCAQVCVYVQRTPLFGMVHSKSLILRELLNVESGNINGGVFFFFLKTKGMNLQNNGV